MEQSPHAPGVSWAAVVGGAVVTASLSLILLALGAGLGLSAVSPWSSAGASAAALGTAAIVWIILMQVMSGAMGGYLAGRLRSRWPSVHHDEVYFRDTAHGFMAWGLALVVTAAFLGTAATAMIGDAASSGGAAASHGRTADPDMYYVDMLLRSGTPVPDLNDAGLRTEVERIFVKSMAQREVTAGDRSYLVPVIAARTGITASAADLRLSDVMAQAQQAADSARKTIAHSLLWIFLALLVGAFSASLAATIGGRQREQVLLV